MSVVHAKASNFKISSDELAALIEKAVLEQVATDRIALPAMPKVAARAFTLLRKRDFSVA